MVVMPLHGKCDVCTERHPDIQKAHRGSLKCAIPPDVVDNNNHVCRVCIQSVCLSGLVKQEVCSVHPIFTLKKA